MQRHQTGFSLIEMMVAMTISAILLAGVVEIFASSKTTYRIQENLSRVQENGRFALDFLTREMRMAGYTGCSSFGPVTNTLNDQGNVLYNFNAGIEGFNDIGATAPAYLSAVGVSPKEGSDVVVVRRLVDNPVRITQNNNGSQVFTEVTSNVVGGCADGTNKISDICEGDILMVSDCKKSRIFQAANLQITGGPSEMNMTHPASGTPGNALASWGGASLPPEAIFGNDAEIFKLGMFVYYIKDSGDGTAALNVYDGSVHSELVGGIEDMQIKYGEDIDADRTIDAYRDAHEVTNWDEVLSVRLHLLLVTQDNNMAPAPQTHTFFGADKTAPDKRLRREFTTTVALRNRAS